MKRIFKTSISILIVGISLSFASCNSTRVMDKTISYYSLINEGQGGKDISSYKKGDANCLTLLGQDHLPYLTLETYKNMLLPYINNGFDYKVTHSNGVDLLTIASNSNPIFMMEFSPKAKTITYQGATDGSLSVEKDYSNSSLMLGMKVEGSIVVNSKPYTFSWGKTSYNVFTRNNQTYYPLSLLDSVISPNTGIHHYYSYKNIYQYINDEALTKVAFVKDGNTYYAFTEALEVINSDIKTMPEYLRQDRYNAFLFIFENLYGLKTTRKIDSMIDYFNNLGLLDDFMNEDYITRNQAFANIFTHLEDAHTNEGDKFNTPWTTGTPITYGPKINKMIEVVTKLSEERKAFYSEVNQEEGSIVYLGDKQEVAYFPFNGFAFANDIYNDDHSIKESLYEQDTFFHMVKQLEEIKNKGSVKKVIVDISQNGGGTLGVLMKVLTLFSKNNSSKIFLKMDNSGYIEKDVTIIDSNLDGKYDLDDVYGDDFQFYLLTSCFSFSCGNALPFLAQQEKIATIIGNDSGGGECSVAEAYLPSGEYFVHSSLMHIGFVENDCDRWIGSEETAKAERIIDYTKYYDTSTLLNAVR